MKKIIGISIIILIILCISVYTLYIFPKTEEQKLMQQIEDTLNQLSLFIKNSTNDYYFRQ